MRSPRRRPFRHAIVLAAGALALAACGGGDDGGGGGGVVAESESESATAADDATSDGTGEETEQSGGDASAELATALTAAFAGSTPLEDGLEFDGASLASGDSVVWFWAPWCTICRAEAPEVAEVAERYAADVQLIGVPGRGEIAAMQEFVDDTGTSGITHLADLDGAVWSAFGVYGQPAFAFVDDSGEVEVFIGGMGGDALADRIDELIAT